MVRCRMIGALAVGAVISCAASCSDGGNVPSSGGTSSSSSGGGEAGGGGAGGGGAAGGGGSSFCEGATPIEFGELIEGDLASTGQEDVYRFIGKKGQVLAIDIDAQYLNNTGRDPTVIDAVVTLFDDLGNQIARNNDPIEYSTSDSRLYTILPNDGTYCVRVSECWTSVPNPGENCAGEKDKVVTNYTLWPYEFIDDPGDSFAADVEQGDTPADATALEYLPHVSGYYYPNTIWGTFRDEQDVDVFGFTVPSEFVLPANTRLTGQFYFIQTGPDENGSTATMGNAWVADASAPEKVLARVDATTNYLLGPRLEVGKPYLLFVTRAPGVTRTNDFYFARHHAYESSPLELEKGVGQNDTPATAEVVVVDMQTNRVYMEGDISMAPADMDHFSATVPANMTMVAAACGGGDIGSGLRDLKLSLLGANGDLLTPTSWDVGDQMQWVEVPYVSVGGNAQVIMKVEAGHQDPMVAQTFYGCGLRFAP